LGVPVAHIHGGETTEGAFDDAMRHAITKLAVLHFAAAEPYRQRIIQMGEAPERVFTVGAPGADAVANLSPLPDADLARATGCALNDPILLVTYHPATARRDSGTGIAALLAALDGFPDAALVFTGVNADPGGSEIAAAVRAWTGRRGGRTAIVESLGQAAYLSLMRRAAAVLGNSSSGIIEAPASGVPSVDIGDRQKGRLKASSVLACPEDAASIRAAITTAMSPAFRSSVAGQALPYGGGGAATRIVAVLRRIPSRTLAGKTFHDLARPAA
jgi:UDP-hydrolysing UDP-N-acetyl-D-glucosamine 2-epimerase